MKPLVTNCTKSRKTDMTIVDSRDTNVYKQLLTKNKLVISKLKKFIILIILQKNKQIVDLFPFCNRKR